MAAVPPEHVQPIRPIRPSGLIWGDLIGERAPAGAEEGEGEAGCEEGRARSERDIGLVADDVREGRAGAGCDLTDHGDLDALREVLEAFADGELDGAVDIVEILQAGILQRRIQSTK